MEDDKLAAGIATSLAASWPRLRITDETITRWAKRFLRSADDAVMSAVERLALWDAPPNYRDLDLAIREAEENLRPTLQSPPAPTVLIGNTDWGHGHFHLERYLASGESPDLRDPDERELALSPWACSCEEWKTPRGSLAETVTS